MTEPKFGLVFRDARFPKVAEINAEAFDVSATKKNLAKFGQRLRNAVYRKIVVKNNFPILFIVVLFFVVSFRDRFSPSFLIPLFSKFENPFDCLAFVGSFS